MTGRPREPIRDSPPRLDYVYPPVDDDSRWSRDRPQERGRLEAEPFFGRRGGDVRPGPREIVPPLSPKRDLRDACQRDLERQSIERRQQAIHRDLASVKEQRDTLDSVFVYDERDDERMARERSLERLQRHEDELRKREEEILAREHALRDALRLYSPTRKRHHDEDGRHRPDEPPYRRNVPGQRERFESPSRGKGSPGPDRFRERGERERMGRRRTPSPKRE